MIYIIIAAWILLGVGICTYRHWYKDRIDPITTCFWGIILSPLNLFAIVAIDVLEKTYPKP